MYPGNPLNTAPTQKSKGRLKNRDVSNSGRPADKDSGAIRRTYVRKVTRAEKPK